MSVLACVHGEEVRACAAWGRCKEVNAARQSERAAIVAELRATIEDARNSLQVIMSESATMTDSTKADRVDLYRIIESHVLKVDARLLATLGAIEKGPTT